MLLKSSKSRADLLVEEAEEDGIENGDNISDSALHMTQTRLQRTCSDEMIRVSKQNKEDNLYLNHSNHAITFDFSHNLQLTHFGEEQPGDTCYFPNLALMNLELQTIDERKINHAASLP